MGQTCFFPKPQLRLATSEGRLADVAAVACSDGVEARPRTDQFMGLQGYTLKTYELLGKHGFLEAPLSNHLFSKIMIVIEGP